MCDSDSPAFAAADIASSSAYVAVARSIGVVPGGADGSVTVLSPTPKK